MAEVLALLRDCDAVTFIWDCEEGTAMLEADRVVVAGRRTGRLAWVAVLAGVLGVAGAGGVAEGQRTGGAADNKASVQEAGAKGGAATQGASASSLIEDRAAKKLLAAGDSRMQLDQAKEALDLYQQVVERYPRSAVRFEAFMRMGKYYLEKARDAGKALPYFERAADELNETPELRGDAMLCVGRCYYEQSKWQQAFAALRQTIAAYPGTDFANQAYFYIGNAHYKLGAYNRAIEAFAKVGTAVTETDAGKTQMEIAKRLFVRVQDIDLGSLAEGAEVRATVSSSSGDKESVKLSRVGGAMSTLYLGELDTGLGTPAANDGVLQVTGKDTVEVAYVDAHTSSKEVNVERKQTLRVVHNAVADFMDGAFRDPLKQVVVGKTAYVRVIDMDQDTGDAVDEVAVKVVAKRPLQKKVVLHAAAEGEGAATGEAGAATAEAAVDVTADPTKDDKIEYLVVDEVTLKLQERPREVVGEGAKKEEKGVRSGVFGGQVPVLPGDVVSGDSALQVSVGDVLEVQYVDGVNAYNKSRQVVGQAAATLGSLGEVKVANQEIRDQQLELQTRLKKAEALTNIGKIYKQLGLKEQADQHFRQGVEECEALAGRARNLGGEVLENMYVRLWKLYLELDDLNNAAAMCLALQKEFPNSQFVDEALLGLGETSQRKGEFDKAVAVYKRVLDLPNSTKKAEALFNIGVCQEEMAKPKLPTDKPNQGLQEAAFVSFQQVFQKYPASGVAGDAVGRMADFFMNNKDYDRAISTFQQALDEYPDAQFTDRVLYDYGRCLYRMGKREESLTKFRQLMSEYPQSKLAGKAKQIVAALEKQGGGGGGEGG